MKENIQNFEQKEGVIFRLAYTDVIEGKVDEDESTVIMNTFCLLINEAFGT